MATSPTDTAAASSTPSVPVFVPVAAPFLTSVDPVDVAVFLKKRESYEREVKSKQAEIPTMTVRPWTASIDLSLLQDLHFMGKFDTIAPSVNEADNLTDEHIKKFITSLVTRSEDSIINPGVIKAALSGLQMPMKIADPDARIPTTALISSTASRVLGAEPSARIIPRKPSNFSLAVCTRQRSSAKCKNVLT